MTLFFLFSLYNPLILFSNLLLDGYKKLISPLQGREVCYFSPTCSQYAKEAINREGFILGVVMTADRLERCNPFAPGYASDFYLGEREGRIFDPPQRHSLFHCPSSRADVLLTPPPSFPFEVWRVEVDTIRPIFIGEPFDLAFADFLYRQNEFSLALLEFQKAKFWASDPRVRDYARVMNAECLFKMGNYPSARREAEEISDKSLRMLTRGRILLAEGKFDSARSQFYYLKDTLLQNLDQFFYGLSYLYEGNFERTLAHFRIKGLSPPKFRSPFIAGFLSLFIPGAGQVYAGRRGDGFYSFLVVGTLAGISYYYKKKEENGKFLTFLSLTSVFHLGNIYGAIIASRDYNLLAKRKFIRRAESVLKDNLQKVDLKEVLLR